MAVYFIADWKCGLMKIGMTDGPPRSRTSNIQTSSPHDLDLAATIEGSYEVEAELHAMFSGQRVRGEWFRISQDLLSEIASRVFANQAEKAEDRLVAINKQVEEWAARTVAAKGPLDAEAYAEIERISAHGDLRFAEAMLGLSEAIAIQEWQRAVEFAGRILVHASEKLKDPPTYRTCILCLRRLPQGEPLGQRTGLVGARFCLPCAEDAVAQLSRHAPATRLDVSDATRLQHDAEEREAWQRSLDAAQ